MRACTGSGPTVSCTPDMAWNRFWAQDNISYQCVAAGLVPYFRVWTMTAVQETALYAYSVLQRSNAHMDKL